MPTAGAESRWRERKVLRTAISTLWSFHGTTWLLRRMTRTGLWAADSRLTALAHWLQSRGATGTISQLRAAVYAALLAGRPLDSLVPGAVAADADPADRDLDPENAFGLAGQEVDQETEDLLEALRDVVDPELGVNVVDLGLIYGVTLGDDRVATIDMTLTSAACPLTDVIEDQTRVGLDGLVNDFRINWVWLPPWGPDKITEDGREQLRALGFNV